MDSGISGDLMTVPSSFYTPTLLNTDFTPVQKAKTKLQTKTIGHWKLDFPTAAP